MNPARSIPPLRPTFALIDLDALAHNVRELRRITSPDAELMCVVKADAYGLGLVDAAPVCLQYGANRLGVAVFDEAQALRSAGIVAPILVIGPTTPWQAGEMVRLGVAATVFTLDVAEALSRAALRQDRKATVHINVDTGMSRIGVRPDAQGLDLVQRIAGLPGIEVEGIFTHFAAADEADKSFTHQQLQRYQRFVDEVTARGIRVKTRHVANSAALLDMPEAHLDMVRPGVLIAGIWPSADVQRRMAAKPAMSLITHAAYVKQVEPGSHVSYGCTYTAPGAATLATLPLGYHDGYKRGLSNQASVLIRGQRAPIRGRVCMDQTIVDVSAIPGASAGDPVVAIGRWGQNEVSADELASYIGTIGYEIGTTVGKRVPRLYVREGRPVKVRTEYNSWTVSEWEDLPWPDVEATYLATRY